MDNNQWCPGFFFWGGGGGGGGGKSLKSLSWGVTCKYNISFLLRCVCWEGGDRLEQNRSSSRVFILLGGGGGGVHLQLLSSVRVYS